MNSTEKAAKERYISRLNMQIEVNTRELNELKFINTFYLIDIIKAQESMLKSLQDE